MSCGGPPNQCIQGSAEEEGERMPGRDSGIRLQEPAVPVLALFQPARNREIFIKYAESRADHGLEIFGDSPYPYGKNGRHEETRTPDLYRVNFEVNNLKPFPHLAFPHSSYPKIGLEIPSFDGELMASYVLWRIAGLLRLPRS